MNAARGGTWVARTRHALWDSRLEILAITAAVVVAVVWTMYTLGPANIDPGNTAWVWGDLAQVYVSWSQFISDPGASWLSSNSMSYPLQMNISLFDPIPILLLAAKALNGLNLSGQYLGVYFVAAMMLQAVFGYLAVRQAVKLANPDVPRNLATYIGFVGSLTWLLIPIVSHRFFGHTALSSKWVLTLAIWAFLATTASTPPRWLLANCAVLFLACGINPYLALMVGGSGAIIVIVDTITHRRWILGPLMIGVYFGTAILALWLFGFLGAASVGGGSFGHFSMNVLGPLDSNGLARLLPLDVPDPTGGQSFEGYNYLGVGILVLLALMLVLSVLPSRRRRFPLWWVIFIVAAFFILAVSNVVTIGNVKIDIPLGTAITDMLSRFRSGGRFFWMSAFWLVVAAVAMSVWRLGAKPTAYLLSALLVVQIIDVQPIATNMRQTITAFQRIDNLSRAVHLDLRSIKAMLVYPPWQCDMQNTPGGGRNYEAVGFFATENNLKTNNFYAARTLRKQKKYHCNYDKLSRRISDQNIYLLSESMNQTSGHLFADGFSSMPSGFEDGSILYYPTRLAP